MTLITIDFLLFDERIKIETNATDMRKRNGENDVLQAQCWVVRLSSVWSEIENWINITRMIYMCVCIFERSVLRSFHFYRAHLIATSIDNWIVRASEVTINWTVWRIVQVSHVVPDAFERNVNRHKRIEVDITCYIEMVDARKRNVKDKSNVKDQCLECFFFSFFY